MNTVPENVDIDNPPIIFRFEHNLKSLIMFIEEKQFNVYPCLKIIPTKPLTLFHKLFFEERFHTLISQAHWKSLILILLKLNRIVLICTLKQMLKILNKWH